MQRAHQSLPRAGLSADEAVDRQDMNGYLAARPAIHPIAPAITKNTTAIQACGSES